MTKSSQGKKSSSKSASKTEDAAQTSNLPKVDIATGIPMAIAAGVSGYLSFGGGQAIFGNDFTALGFTLVVQTVVCVALWYFALARGIQRPLLMAVWAIAVTFSIMTAYVSADRVNDGNDVELAKQEVTEFIRQVGGKIAAAEAAAEAKDAEAKAEEENGGCGPICRGLKDEAVALRSAANSSALVMPDIEVAKKAYSGQEAVDLLALSAIYQEMRAKLGTLADGITEPNFIRSSTRTPFDRIALGFKRLFGANDETYVQTLGAIWVAFLMEILAVACALIRLAAYVRPSERSLGERMEAALAWLYNLRTLPARVATLEARRMQSWENANKSRTGGSSRRAKPTPGSNNSLLKSDQDFWRTALHAQAQASETSVLNLIIDLLQGQKNVRVQAPIETKELEKQSVILTVLQNTDVLDHDKNGWVPNEKWREWNNFLLGEFSQLSQSKPSSGKTGLRSVA